MRATDRAEALGVQDLAFIARKQHPLAPALPALASLLGPQSIMVPPTTGIPYWYFHGLDSAHTGRRALADQHQRAHRRRAQRWRTACRCCRTGTAAGHWRSMC